LNVDLYASSRSAILELISVSSPVLIIRLGPSITFPISATSWLANSFSNSSLFAGLIVTTNLDCVSEKRRWSGRKSSEVGILVGSISSPSWLEIAIFDNPTPSPPRTRLIDEANNSFSTASPYVLYNSYAFFASTCGMFFPTIPFSL